MEHVGFDKRVTAEGLASCSPWPARSAPRWAQATVSATWAGLRPGTDDKLPILGAPAPLERLYLATGHLPEWHPPGPHHGTAVSQLPRW